MSYGLSSHIVRFSIGFLITLPPLHFKSSWCIGDISFLFVIYIADVFSQFVIDLLTFLIISFAIQKFKKIYLVKFISLLLHLDFES